ncbi:MAG: hypothetical protein ACKO7W_22750 [Elainella sp.]
MAQFTPEDILEGARTIRFFLPDLLGTEAEAVDQQLAELLGQAKAGQQADQQILEILKGHPETYRWIAEFLSSEPDPKSPRLPGLPNAVSAPKYVCPEGDYSWFQRSIGIPVPSCPTHGKLTLEG